MSTLEVDTIDTKTGTNSLTIKQNDTATITIDTSQNVGIGTTSPTGSGQVLHLNSSSTVTDFHMTNSTTGSASTDGLVIRQSGLNSEILNREAGNTIFYNNGAESMRIDSSGLVGINTSSPTRQFNVYSTGIPVAKFERNQGDNNLRTHVEFIREGSSVGEIQCTNTSTTYATSSDYRLKENVIDLTDATTRVKQLQPKRFNFIADADTTVDGFLAHEVSDIVPEAITGTHNEVDEEGNPVYQGIDQSKLVPLLTASLKEAIAKIEELETRIATLENA